MRLKRLVLQGFKSFKDRQTVHFDDGITGIVGPNGCGKSNIVDALFWVMGEMSAKHLRGKSMKDLIFAGSSKYNPSGFAEVTLILENDEGKSIHIGDKVSAPSEIQLTRKLYRSGDTEYRINGIPARLRDIQEVFMDTGAGAKSYSIIAQGEINRLVQQKPEERRVMIEEVAGITKFKMRKKESVRKMEATEANLNRLLDLQSEVHKNLKALERQSEKAERAKRLKEQIRKTDLSVNAHKELDFLKDLKDNNKFIIENEGQVKEWSERKDSIEEGLVQEREQRKELNSKIESENKILREESSEHAKQESQLSFSKKSLKEKNVLLKRREEENTQLQDELEERRTRLMDLQEDLKELEAKKQDEFDIEEIEGKVDSLKERMEMKEGTLSEVRSELDDEKKALFSKEQELYKTVSRINELSSSLEDITKEMEELEEQFSSVSGEIAGEREKVIQYKEQSEELEKQLASVSESIIKEEKSLKDLESNLKEKTKELISNESRLSSLEQIEASMSDQGDGSRVYLEQNQDARTLGSLIECNDEYEAAVSAGLREIVNHIVLKDQNLQIDLVKENDLSAKFLLPNFKENLNLDTSRYISLREIVRVKDEAFTHALDLLSNIYIDREFSTSSKDEYFNSGAFAIVSMDGKSVYTRTLGNTEFSFISSKETQTGAIARNNEMKKLNEMITALREEIEKIEVSVKQSEEQLQGHKASREEHRASLMEAKTEYAGLKSALDSKVQNFEKSNSRINVLKERKAKLSSEKIELIEQEETLQKASEELRSTTIDKEEIIEEFSAEVQDLRVSYTEEKEALLELQMEIKSFDERRDNFMSQIGDIEKQIERASEKLQANTELNEEGKTEIEELETSITELATQTEEMKVQLKEKERALKDLKNDFNALNQLMQRRENEVKSLTTKITKTEKDMIAKQTKVEQIIEDEEHLVRDVFERYRIDLRENLRIFLEQTQEDMASLKDLESMYFMESTNEEGEVEKVRIEVESYEFQRKYGQEVRDLKYKLKNYKQSLQKLGEINWQAVEDYDKQKLRYQFIKEQEEELRASLTDLESAIEKIDVKSKERFKEAFNEVNMRFEKVFPIIFGGGSAKLQVVGSLEDPDCGIDIIAQPPGKKMQNINLMSGGEKAMTAVSLIFSIFLVKPSPFCLLDEVDAPLDDANVGRFNDLLREMSSDSQFILITHNKKTMELNDTLYGVTMQEPGISTAVSVQLQ